MADTLIREGISYGSNPFSPVPQYWNGTSYEKVQGVNGATRIIAYDSAGETFTNSNPGSAAVVSSAGGTAVLNSGNPAVVEIVLTAGGTAAFANANPGFAEIVSSAGGTAYFSTVNPGIVAKKIVTPQNNAWSANSTISSGQTSQIVDTGARYKVEYFGTVTNTASITLSLEVSQNLDSFYVAETKTITAGTTSPFYYSIDTAARYARLSASGVSATISATIVGDAAAYGTYVYVSSNMIIET